MPWKPLSEREKSRRLRANLAIYSILVFVVAVCLAALVVGGVLEEEGILPTPNSTTSP